uniref:Fe-S cluster assembly protein SufD n=1 Tax=Vaginimicrobium propionicum TaxID=1871034 RepID=UPI00097023F6|nr:Fe-S cluster assembly protein SufD [Vaginimicrobium propionicum]
MLTNTLPKGLISRPKLKSHLHPKPSWDKADHQEPNGREEVWRFSPIETLKPLFSAGECFTDWQINEQSGVNISLISQNEAIKASCDAPVDLVAWVAGQSRQATLVTVAENTVLADPLIFDLTGQHERLDAHMIIEVGANAQATIVMRFLGAGQLASKVELHVGDGAQVNFVSLQDWNAGSLHGGQISTLVGRDAQVRLIQASIGGDLIRQVERATYAGEGGRLEQFGLYFVDGARHVEHRIFIDHTAANTYSHADYRGALQGNGAHSVWIGDVLIRAAAKNIETYETNRNLVLTEGCQADSVPNLEIETGEIKGAGHSSSTGRFDDEQLFYLRSRGIPEDKARRLIVEGFFLDLIRRIRVPQVQSRLVEALNHELMAVEGLAKEQILAQEDL